MFALFMTMDWEKSNNNNKRAILWQFENKTRDTATKTLTGEKNQKLQAFEYL